MQLLPESYWELLLYKRTMVFEWQWWRVITAHFVHLSWLHLVFNSLGLLVLGVLLPVASSWFLGWVIVLSLGVSVGLILGSAEVAWYGGFSGVLVGLYITIALHCFEQHKVMSTAVLMIVCANILFEQLVGQSITVSSLSGIPVVTDAHYYGALTALLLVGGVKLVIRVRSTC